MSEDYQNYSGGGDQQNGGKGFAIASMVLGIISIVCTCWWYLGIPCGIIGLILGIMHNKKVGKNGMATAGIVCSIVGLVLGLIFLILAAIGLAVLGGLSALTY